ncbi:MAG: histidine kinase [Flavobacteriaceae bacterium]|nr:histidine kinase [Flavobacteriaceae bacterium]
MKIIRKYGTQILVHILFWILFVFVSLFMFSKYYWTENPFLQFVSLLIFVVYLNNGLLLPFFVKRKWYLAYISLFALIAFVTTKIYCDVFAQCGCSIMKCMSDYLWQTLTPLVFFSFIWLLFRFIDEQEKFIKAKQERTEIELKFLKSQINPHVLFNNLNTIYSYSIEKPNETPELILKLSDNLKHILYESNSDFIELKKELHFIDNYIDFQRLRTEGIKTIHYKTVTDKTDYKIAPLLLITIIENAFKHSDINADIRINITVKNNILELFCQNSFSKTNTNNRTSIGLKNLHKRLEILYKDNYILEVKQEELYTVTLKINL